MPSAIQIFVMTAHMIVASPALTLVSAMVSEDIVFVCGSFALDFLIRLGFLLGDSICCASYSVSW